MNATIQEVWLHGILTEFGIPNSSMVDLYCDNQSTIKVSSDPNQKQRTEQRFTCTTFENWCMTKPSHCTTIQQRIRLRIFLPSLLPKRDFPFLGLFWALRLDSQFLFWGGFFPRGFPYLSCIMHHSCIFRLYIGCPMVLLPCPTIVQVRIQGGC